MKAELDVEKLEQRLSRFGWDINSPTFSGPTDLADWIVYQVCYAWRIAKEYKKDVRDSVRFSRSWWGSRMATMDQWMRDNAPKEAKHEYFCILANGSKAPFARSDSDKTGPVYTALLGKLDELTAELNSNKSKPFQGNDYY